MDRERIYLTIPDAVYADISQNPFELVSFQHFETMYGLRGVNLRVMVSQARKKLTPNCAIFGVQGDGYTFTNSPVSYGDILSIQGIRQFSTEWLDKQALHRQEISNLVGLIQKGLVCNRMNTITPVIPDEEYKLLLRLIGAYAHNKKLSVEQLAYSSGNYAYNLLGRLRGVLRLATDNQWDFAQQSHKQGYVLQQIS